MQLKYTNEPTWNCWCDEVVVTWFAETVVVTAEEDFPHPAITVCK